MSKNFTPGQTTANGCTQSPAPVFCCVNTTANPVNNFYKKDDASSECAASFFLLCPRTGENRCHSVIIPCRLPNLNQPLLIRQWLSTYIPPFLISRKLIGINTSYFMKKLFSKSGMLAMMLMVVSLFFVSAAIGQTNTWTGTTNANWGTPTNWSLGIVPLSTHTVIIPDNATGGNDNPTVDVAAVCATLTMSTGTSARTLTISGTNSLTLSGALSIETGTGSGDNKIIAVGSGSLSCASISLANTGGNDRDCEVTLSSGTVTVSGNITMSGANDENAVRFTSTGILETLGAV